MFFGKPKPTVTPEDKEWVEEAFLWFEQQYGRDFLKCVRTIEPTKEFFQLDFKGTEQDAELLTGMICEYMQIKEASIELYYFSDKPLEFTDGISIQRAEGKPGPALGLYSDNGKKFSIGIETSVLKDPINLIATLAHELSHLILLGEGRLAKNDEELTDLNTVAMGFGIFTANTAFRFHQWRSATHQGWQVNRQGYIPEEVSTYGLALLANYQGIEKPEWTKHLNPSARKMFDRNMKYLRTTTDDVKFK
jgi:hypothetical protein